MKRVKSRRTLIILILLLNSSFGIAQDSATYVRRYSHTWRAISLAYGNANIRKNEFSSYFIQAGNPKFGTDMPYLALSFGGSSNYLDDANIHFKYFLPQKLTINDSTRYELNGFQINFPIYHGLNLLFMVKNFDMPLHLGYNYGVMYLKKNDISYRNPFFSFNMQIKPRIVIKKWVFSTTFDANWDISKSNWKSKSDINLENLAFKSTYLGIHFGIGYLFFDYKSGYVRIYK